MLGCFLSTCGPRASGGAPHPTPPTLQRTSQASRVPKPLPYRMQRDRGTHPFLQATRCSPASLSLKLREPTQPLSATALSPEPTTHQSPNWPPVPIPLPLRFLSPYVKWRQDRGGNSSQPITHRFLELLYQWVPGSMSDNKSGQCKGQ